MLSRYTTTLLTKSIAALQAFALAITPPLLASCQCAQAEAAAEPSGGCCAGQYCNVASKPCCAPEDDADDCQNCSCSRPIKQATALINGGPLRGDDSQDASPPFLASPHLADLGLHAADWSTAFDLEAPDGPLGLRLHALFSVWRN